ncbi:hypothetical protein LguiB_009548 [Lonicera macranthoides]
MGYEYEDGSLISKTLVLQILKLHQLTKNAIASNKYIIFGAGSTQLLNAAVHALSVGSHNTSPTKVVASIPYYPVYKSQTELFESKRYKFKGDTSLWKKKCSNSSSSMNFIEFVTSPNNPDGQLKKGILKGGSSSVKTIHDLAYYWPHYTPIPAALDEDLMIFTLSKLTGHSGSRFGWALIKDKDVYERMVKYVDVNTYGVPRETQLRALKLIKVVLEEEGSNNGSKIFEFGYETMKHRWQKLSKSLSISKRFSLQDLPPQYCTFSQIVRSPSPAFAWIKCEREEDKDCYKVLKEGKIKGRGGMAFGAEKSYVRLSLCKSNDDFDLLLQRIEKLAFQEEKVVTTTLILGENIRNCTKVFELCSIDEYQYGKTKACGHKFLIHRNETTIGGLGMQ